MEEKDNLSVSEIFEEMKKSADEIYELGKEFIKKQKEKEKEKARQQASFCHK